MKKRRTLIITLLLLAALALGIGYAAYTDELTATGTANVKTDGAKAAFDADVYFDPTYIKKSDADDAYIDAGSGATANDKAEFTVQSVAVEGDQAIFTFKIVNTSTEFDAVLIPTLHLANSSFFKIDYVFSDADITDKADSRWDTSSTTGTVEAGGELLLNVRVTLIASPIDAISGTIGHVNLSAAPAKTTTTP